ncbi:MAG: flagellar hook-associated protein FlgK [Fimbriimonas ginsengisoli]|uniref:Flagellar hook-associated protein 1 n=1 Tax=Fimbriimonas ginsengisoli TaxID=1005039 RepID=A0A931LQZ1_FIMGI|nr:flagellar hook-associated protein FlgK [Fimbriimonas ginsengisoli]
MPSPFLGIDIASQALRAFQRALDVTGHNISNVNTPGYSRQVTDFTEITPTTFFGTKVLALGQGVGIDAVNRIRDAFLDARMIAAQGDLGKSTTLSDGLKQVESAMNDTTGNGIGDALDQFFNAWSALASNPNDPATRVQVQQAGSLLAGKVRSAYQDLSTLKAQQQASVTGTLDQIDQLTATIADLNNQIRNKPTFGDVPNDLLDKRDQAIRELSGLVDIHTYDQSDGSVTITMNQLTLVDRGGARLIPRTFDTATGQLSDANGTYDVRGGKLAGVMQAVNTISGYQSQLDLLANTLRTQVNSVHATGTNPLGTTGINFFNDANPQTGAIDFDLDPAIKADAQAISSGASGNPGDGGLALSLSRLRDQTLAGLGGQTVSGYYTGLVSQIGRDASSSQTTGSTQTAVVQQIDSQIQSASGVSLDDEMANMLRFQRSYQAAAKVLSVFDQATDDLIKMLP